MHVLITGGAGFIGQYLAARLVDAGHSVTALDNLSGQVHADVEASRARFPGEVIVGDVADPAAWAGLEKADAIVHLAAETGTGQSMYEQDRYRRVNVDGTRFAGDTARAWEVPLVAMSSRAVYGNGRFECGERGESYAEACCADAAPAPSRESDPHHPVSVYGETKSEGEAALREHATVIPVDVVRPQNVVGFGQALHNPYTGVLAAFLARLREGRPLSVYGDGTATRDFVHVSDVAALLAWLVENPTSPGQMRVLNSGTGVRTNLTELATYAREAAPRATGEIEYVDVHRAGDIDHAVADLSFADSVGAPRAQMSSKDAIQDFIRRSWDVPGADSSAWDDALRELGDRGLTN